MNHANPKKTVQQQTNFDLNLPLCQLQGFQHFDTPKFDEAEADYSSISYPRSQQVLKQQEQKQKQVVYQKRLLQKNENQYKGEDMGAYTDQYLEYVNLNSQARPAPKQNHPRLVQVQLPQNSSSQKARDSAQRTRKKSSTLWTWTPCQKKSSAQNIEVNSKPDRYQTRSISPIRCMNNACQKLVLQNAVRTKHFIQQFVSHVKVNEFEKMKSFQAEETRKFLERKQQLQQ